MTTAELIYLGIFGAFIVYCIVMWLADRVIDGISELTRFE